MPSSAVVNSGLLPPRRAHLTPVRQVFGHSRKKALKNLTSPGPRERLHQVRYLQAGSVLGPVGLLLGALHLLQWHGDTSLAPADKHCLDAGPAASGPPYNLSGLSPLRK